MWPNFCYKQVFIKDEGGAGKGVSVSSAHCLWLPSWMGSPLCSTHAPMISHPHEAEAWGQCEKQGTVGSKGKKGPFPQP